MTWFSKQKQISRKSDLVLLNNTRFIQLDAEFSVGKFLLWIKSQADREFQLAVTSG